MDTSKAIARNTALQVVGKVLATVFGVITVGILTRHLGASGYGDLTVILTFLIIFAVVVDFGLTLTTVQLISEKPEREGAIIANLLSLRIISAVGFLALAPVAALFFPYSEAVKIGIAVGAFAYLFGTTAQMLVGVFQKRLLMGRVVLAELANRTLVLAGAALAPFIGLPLIGVVLLFVIGNGAQLVSILVFAKKYVNIRLKLDFDLWKTIIARSWPIGASIFFNLVYLRGDILFLSFFRDSAEIGIYGAAYKIVDVVTVVPTMYMGLILPILVASWAKQNKQRFKKFMQQAFDFFALFAIPLALGAIAVGEPLMAFIAGEEFRTSGLVLAILGPAASMVFFGALFGHAIVGINKQKQMVVGYASVAALTVAGYLAFIPQFGIWAAAWLTLASEILITLVTYIVVTRVSGYRPKLTMTVRAALGAIVMFLALNVLPQTHVLVDIAIGATVYAVAVAALGGPKPRDVISLFLPERPPISQP